MDELIEPNHLNVSADGCVWHFLLKTKDDNFGVVVWPLTHSKVQVTVDFLACKQSNMMHLQPKTQRHIVPPSRSHLISLHSRWTFSS